MYEKREGHQSSAHTISTRPPSPQVEFSPTNDIILMGKCYKKIRSKNDRSFYQTRITSEGKLISLKHKYTRLFRQSQRFKTIRNTVEGRDV